MSETNKIGQHDFMDHKLSSLRVGGDLRTFCNAPPRQCDVGKKSI